MRRQSLTLLLTFSACSIAQTPAPTDHQLKMHVKIPMRDGIYLNATLYKPVPATSPLPISCMPLYVKTFRKSRLLERFHARPEKVTSEAHNQRQLTIPAHAPGVPANKTRGLLAQEGLKARPMPA